MRRWFGDPLFWRTLLRALSVGAGAGAGAALAGWPYPIHEGIDVALGVAAGATSMRVWTWKERKSDE